MFIYTRRLFTKTIYKESKILVFHNCIIELDFSSLDLLYRNKFNNSNNLDIKSIIVYCDIEILANLKEDRTLCLYSSITCYISYHP